MMLRPQMRIVRHFICSARELPCSAQRARCGMQDQVGSDVPYRAALSSIQTGMAWLEQYGDDGCAWLTQRMLERDG